MFCDDLVWITYFIVRNNAFGIGKAVKGNVNNQFITDAFFYLTDVLKNLFLFCYELYSFKKLLTLISQMFFHSNGRQNFTIQKWTLNVLERNKSSCFNKNHLTTEIQNAGTGHSLKCSDLSVNENDSVTWYKVIAQIISCRSKTSAGKINYEDF